MIKISGVGVDRKISSASAVSVCALASDAEMLCVAVGVMVAGTSVAVADGVGDGVFVIVADGVSVALGVFVAVRVADGVCVGSGVLLGMRVGDAGKVNPGAGVPICVCIACIVDTS